MHCPFLFRTALLCYIKLLVFAYKPSSVNQLRNLALWKPSFKPNSINSQKKSESNGKNVIHITDIEKMFSDTAQYFHSKHQQNGPKCHEKHFFFFRNGVKGPKSYFPKFIASCSFMPT